MVHSTPFELKKDSFEKYSTSVTAPGDQDLLRCCEELRNAVRNEDMRIGHLLSLETQEIIKADGAGLKLLGYNPSEWHLYPFIQSIPRAYAWIYALYREKALETINQVQCGNCHFSINIPIQDRSRKKCYWAQVRSWVVDYQKPENKPRILLVTINLLQNWSFNDPPMLSVGKFNNMTFPDAMDDCNLNMKKYVSEEILSGHLGLQPTELKTIQLMHEEWTTPQIAEKLNVSVHSVNFFKREIIKNCNQHLGHLPDAKQWVHYLSQAFTL